MDLGGSVDNLVEFENIWKNDKVSCFGLEACPSDTSDHGFYAFVILIVKDWEDENFF